MHEIVIAATGHRTRLKWHRLKRQKTDIAFTRTRLSEGAALGASLEVDVRALADGGFVCLHDATLDRETTGHGRVGEADAAGLAALRMRGNAGDATAEAPLGIDELAGLLAGSSPATLLQLDFKDDPADLSGAHAERFRQALATIAGQVVLSGSDPHRLSALAGDLGLRIGYDPCADDTADLLMSGEDVEHFADAAIRQAPFASHIYLDYRIIVAAERLGRDIIGRFHRAGMLIDAYTLNTDHPGAGETAAILMARQVDQITTDEPGELGRLLVGLQR